ncbi:MAG TPA: ThiF family adenylyltransferase [Solirubrobacteraceae bacterium]|jgi:molybdopterin/thiamine biosynthesis adenylyltransferase|nr:ThiF family adenylyltransferase [Solirubrobacteraceae bacterium]
MKRWTDRYPQRFEHEIEAFRTTEGLNLSLDEVELKRSGRVIFRGTLMRGSGDPMYLEVRYPDLFPFFRPEVFAPNHTFPRHQGRYRKNLCLLDRSTDQWLTENTGAWLVSERVPFLLGLLEGDPEVMRTAEAPQGEPLTTYLPYPEGAVVFVPGEIRDAADGEVGGDLKLAMGAPEQTTPLRACMTELAADRGSGQSAVLATAAEPLAGRFAAQALRARWVRLHELPAKHGDASSLLKAAKQSAGYKKPPATALTPVNGAQTVSLRWLGVVVKDEVTQGVWEDTWFFIVTSEKRIGGVIKEDVPTLVRSERLSQEDLSTRIPALSGLAGKVIVLIGLGALGGPLALELLRAQVGELRALEHDVVSAGTIVRWPVGLTAVGHLKTTVLQGVADANYPFTTVKTYKGMLGGVLAEGETEDRPQLEILDELFDGADIVIDATAELGVRHLVSTIARQLAIPQVYVSATQGGWGGVVARVVPGETGCWWCLQKRLFDGSIEDAPYAKDGNIQPAGCGSRTWTGTSFDALPIVAQAARTACFTLLAGRTPGADDVFVCHQAAASASELTAPGWKSYALTAHSQCPYCQEDAQAAAA